MSYSTDNPEMILEYINGLLKSTGESKIFFIDSIDNLVAMRNAERNRFSEPEELRIQVCILGDKIHCEEAKTLNLPCMDEEELSKLNKDEKCVEELAHKYDAFLASDTIMEKIPEILGPSMNKTPFSLSHNESMAEKVKAVKATISTNMKKLMCLFCGNGSCSH